MQSPGLQERDPLDWCVAIALAFLVTGLVRLGLPAKTYFDEVHYVGAARDLLLLVPSNREHPLVGKEIIAASIALFGDRPFAWRLPALLFGTLGLFAFARLTWWASQRRFATVAATLLLATNFTWFVQSRIAMLDIFAASLAVAALWMFAAATRRSDNRPRLRLALCGILLGLALGAKWTAVPVAILPGLALFALKRWPSEGTRPFAAIPLIEAAFWLGALPLLVYWSTFAPAFFYDRLTIPFWDFVGHHRKMLELQDSVIKPHPYQSVWYHWIVNWRPIWYLYEPVEGAQRGILMLGNPFTMLAGLPALLWCLWAGVRRGRRDALAFAALYCFSLGLWLVSGKPVQFYYHYVLPGAFLMGCLALLLDDLLRKGGWWRLLPVIVLLGSMALFVWFYPILSAAALADGRGSYVKWMWLHSWR